MEKKGIPPGEWLAKGYPNGQTYTLNGVLPRDVHLRD